MSAKMNTSEIQTLVKEMALSQNDPAKQKQIRDAAREAGIFPASIQGLYEAIGKGSYPSFTVPAMNIRGITYDVARAAFRAAMKNNVGPFIFEIARSEMSYTFQIPGEYSACILAAALTEGYQGPVFLQADHTQVIRKNYIKDSRKELDFLRNLIRQCVEAGFYNIDIDASTLVDIEKEKLTEQQLANSLITAEFTRFIRNIEPKGVTVSVGGEIGEIGHGNSTVGDLEAYMEQYLHDLPPGIKGISKISVQTGTTHGGVTLPDGSIAKVQLDFNTLETLSKLARVQWGLGGAVQHGASTLPDEMFDIFPRVGTLEVHLATGFQNMIFDSSSFPKPLREKIYAGLDAKYGNDREKDETEAQFIYRQRKRAFGDFKSDLWNMPPEVLQKISQELEDRFSLLYRKLNVINTKDEVKMIKPA
jgi:fructose/tagatose bisphosphate aldolase